jgi:polar amino acid transport system substrate-binding protein
VSALVAAAGLVWGCAVARQAPPSGGDGQSVLRVGITPDAPPMIFRDSGTPAGFEADMAAALAAALGRDLQFVELPWLEQVPALQDGKIDIIMSAMSITQVRSFYVGFSRPYLRAGLAALVPEDRVDDFEGPMVLYRASGRIGVQAGTTGEAFVGRFMPLAEPRPFDRGADILAALRAGDVDAVVHDAPVLQWLQREGRAEGLAVAADNLTVEYYAWAVRKDDEELLAAVNAALDGWAADGTLAAAVAKWMPGLQ